jgi:GNAT superfamily N-acetyltransferase
VHPDFQRLGIGRDLVRAVTNEAFKAGCDWVHVDYEPEFASFYENACGFRPTPAGLRSARLAQSARAERPMRLPFCPTRVPGVRTRPAGSRKMSWLRDRPA